MVGRDELVPGKRAAGPVAPCEGEVNNGTRPGTGDAPLDYRFRFCLLRTATTSMRTATAIVLASFDVRTRTSQGKVSSSVPAGLPNGDSEEPGSR